MLMIIVIGATSGDTGSAAIYGLRRKKDVSVFILHPKGKISPVQEAQMTSVLDPNVHNVAVDGTFDDCQVRIEIMKMIVVTEVTYQSLGYRQSSICRSRDEQKAQAGSGEQH